MILRRFGFLACIAATVLVVFAPAVEATRGMVRNDAIDEHYLIGALTWTGTTGGIAWDREAPSDALGGAANPDQHARDDAGQAHYSATSDPSLLTVDRFRSAPVPETLYLNVSRLVQVDLTLTNGYCNVYDWDLVIKVGDKLLGGHRLDDQVAYGINTWPAGKCIKWARIQPELDVIPQGSVVEIALIRTADSGVNVDDAAFPPRIVTAGPHRSLVRIASFPAAEVPLRIPTHTNGLVSGLSDTAPDGGSPAAGTLVGPAGLLLGLAGFSLRGPRRVRMTGLVVALMMATGFAGCTTGPAQDHVAPSSDAKAPLGGSANSTFVPDIASNGNGTITGTIADDMRIPVVGAYVALLGSSHWMVSDGQGRFRFQGVTPRAYTLRVDKADFRSFEGPVEARAGQVTVIDVEILPTVARAFRPHHHDYWGTDNRVLFLETDVVVASGGTSAFGQTVGAGAPSTACECIGSVRLPDPTTDGRSLVRPGTYIVEVVLDWAKDPQYLNWAGLELVPNHDLNRTPMMQRGRLEPTFMRTAWEMTDVGHQTFSTWQIFIVLDKRGQGTLVLPPSFHIEIFLHKGVVPLEPAHHDFWGTANELPVLSRVPVSVSCTTSPCEFPSGRADWVPKALVPPGSRELRFTLEQSEVSQPTAPEWKMAYKPANVPPQPKDDYSKFQSIASETKSGLKREFRLTVAADEADAFYALKSNWRFALDDGQPNAVTFSNPNPITFWLTVTATRPPPDPVVLSGLLP